LLLEYAICCEDCCRLFEWSHCRDGSFMVCLGGLDCNGLDLTVPTYLRPSCLRDVEGSRLNRLTWKTADRSPGGNELLNWYRVKDGLDAPLPFRLASCIVACGVGFHLTLNYIMLDVCLQQIGDSHEDGCDAMSPLIYTAWIEGVPFFRYPMRKSWGSCLIGKSSAEVFVNRNVGFANQLFGYRRTFLPLFPSGDVGVGGAVTAWKVVRNYVLSSCSSQSVIRGRAWKVEENYGMLASSVDEEDFVAGRITHQWLEVGVAVRGQITLMRLSPNEVRGAPPRWLCPVRELLSS
uniref:DUF608 domain-containing protein n=1 Tax=Taenia asiatica TaxID=60517 RepID=A0A158R973_TAEAS